MSKLMDCSHLLCFAHTASNLVISHGNPKSLETAVGSTSLQDGHRPLKMMKSASIAFHSLASAFGLGLENFQVLATPAQPSPRWI
jgi:hypothetical protein